MQLHMIAGGPTPVAPFSHAVEADGFVFVTGQMPDSPAAPGVLPEGIAAQTHAVMANLQTVLSGLRLTFEQVVMARVYLTRFKDDYAAMNLAYQSYFAEGHLPARTCVGVTGLAYDALIEIDLVARRGAAPWWTCFRRPSLGIAVRWGIDLARDLAAVGAGGLEWSAVDRSCPADRGARMREGAFRKVLAATCQIRLISGSSGKWHGSGASLQGDLLKAMARTFSDARGRALHPVHRRDRLFPEPG